MTIEVREIEGSAYWASAIINGDESGLDEAEVSLLYAWMDCTLAEGEYIVDCGEPYFSWSYGLHTGADVRGGDLVTYTVHRPRG